MTTRFDPPNQSESSSIPPAGDASNGETDNRGASAVRVLAPASPAPHAVTSQSTGVATEAAPSTAPDGDMPLTMPASPAVAAEDISAIGVEGKPGDPESGPGMLRLEVIGLGVLFIAIAIGAGVWLGWATGVAVFAWLALAVVFNPVLLATLRRIKDRRLAVRKEREEVIEVHPDITTTPRSREHADGA